MGVPWLGCSRFFFSTGWRRQRKGTKFFFSTGWKRNQVFLLNRMEKAAKRNQVFLLNRMEKEPSFSSQQDGEGSEKEPSFSSQQDGKGTKFFFSTGWRRQRKERKRKEGKTLMKMYLPLVMMREQLALQTHNNILDLGVVYVQIALALNVILENELEYFLPQIPTISFLPKLILFSATVLEINNNVQLILCSL